MELVENDFRVKEMNAKERATFQNVRIPDHPDKIPLFLRCQECQKCIESLRPKQWNLRSRKLALHLINGAETNVNKY